VIDLAVERQGDWQGRPRGQWRTGGGNVFAQLQLQGRKGSRDARQDGLALPPRCIGDDPCDQLELLKRPIRQQLRPAEQKISGNQHMDQDQRDQDQGRDLAADPPEAEECDNGGGAAHASSTTGVKM
jgi:hypothetical protein